MVKKIASISAAARAPEAANRAWLCGALRVPAEENKKKAWTKPDFLQVKRSAEALKNKDFQKPAGKENNDNSFKSGSGLLKYNGCYFR